MGTGPYTLAEHQVGQKAVLKKRGEPYWGENLDNPYIGGPIYLDEIQYIDHGSASAAQLAADGRVLAEGQAVGTRIGSGRVRRYRSSL